MAPTSAEPQEMPTPTQSLTVDVYPNPVVYSTQRSSATVQFSLPKPLETPTLQVYNTKGQLVHKQTLSTLDAGVHALPFAAQDADGRLLSSGLYYVSIKAEGYTGATKVMVMK
jgi:flagellar hook assembly protein FlgD